MELKIKTITIFYLKSNFYRIGILFLFFAILCTAITVVNVFLEFQGSSQGMDFSYNILYIVVPTMICSLDASKHFNQTTSVNQNE